MTLYSAEYGMYEKLLHQHQRIMNQRLRSALLSFQGADDDMTNGRLHHATFAAFATFDKVNGHF